MYFFSSSGTWVHGWPDYSRIVEYIHSCEVFPNIKMIIEAVGVSEQRAKRAVSHIFAQENRYFSRFFFLADTDGSSIIGIAKEEMLIYSYLEREEKGKDISSRPVIRSFLDRHRYYDDDGNIRYRFSEEEVFNAVNAYNRYCEESDDRSAT